MIKMTSKGTVKGHLKRNISGPLGHVQDTAHKAHYTRAPGTGQLTRAATWMAPQLPLVVLDT